MTCPVPVTPPWSPEARRNDAELVLRIRRARYPACRRLGPGGPCVACMADVVPWKMPPTVQRRLERVA